MYASSRTTWPSMAMARLEMPNHERITRSSRTAPVDGSTFSAPKKCWRAATVGSAAALAGQAAKMTAQTMTPRRFDTVAQEYGLDRGEQPHAALDRRLGHMGMAEHQPGRAVAGVAVQRQPFEADTVAGRGGQEARLIHVGRQLDEHVQSAAAGSRSPLRELALQRAEQRVAALRVAQAHAPQVPFELAARDEVGERELSGDLRACILDRLGGDQRP